VLSHPCIVAWCWNTISVLCRTGHCQHLLFVALILLGAWHWGVLRRNYFPVCEAVVKEFSWCGLSSPIFYQKRPLTNTQIFISLCSCNVLLLCSFLKSTTFMVSISSHGYVYICWLLTRRSLVTILYDPYTLKGSFFLLYPTWNRSTHVYPTQNRLIGAILTSLLSLFMGGASVFLYVSSPEG